MEKLKEFVNIIYEAEKSQLYDGKGNKVPRVDIKDVKTKNLGSGGKIKAGEPEDYNGSGGAFSLDRPFPDWQEQLAKMEIKKMDANAKTVAHRFATEHDFMILGEAGWAKTATVKEQAQKRGYHLITIYLDKAEPVDLQGIGVPIGKGENVVMRYTLPPWAKYMADHKELKFCVFFDEMNQADPAVMNALMPIILEHRVCGIEYHNFFVGAAGNLQYENREGVSELSGPLKSRVNPIIKWQTHTEAAWDGAFKYLHGKYDSKVGKELVDKFYDLREWWSSPRDIVRIVFEFAVKPTNDDKWKDYADPEMIRSYLDELIYEKKREEFENSNRANDALDELADYIVTYIENGGPITADDVEENTEGGKGMDNIDEATKQNVINALHNGYINYDLDGKSINILATQENVIRDLWDAKDTGITAEVLRKIIRQMEAEGKSIKFATDKEGEEYAKKHNWLILREDLKEHPERWEFSNGHLDLKHIISASAEKPVEKKPARRHAND